MHFSSGMSIKFLSLGTPKSYCPFQLAKAAFELQYIWVQHVALLWRLLAHLGTASGLWGLFCSLVLLTDLSEAARFVCPGSGCCISVSVTL